LAPLGKSKMEEIEIQRRAKDRQCNMAWFTLEPERANYII
jgi:hypothetical protein